MVVPHGGELKSLWGGRHLELGVESSMIYLFQSLLYIMCWKRQLDDKCETNGKIQCDKYYEHNVIGEWMRWNKFKSDEMK